jgi:hypothetical protein
MTHYDEGDTCPLCLGKGIFEIHHPRDGGCNCPSGNPPCSWCTDTTLQCAYCGADSYDAFDVVAAIKAEAKADMEASALTDVPSVVTHHPIARAVAIHSNETMQNIRLGVNQYCKVES